MAALVDVETKLGTYLKQNLVFLTGIPSVQVASDLRNAFVR